MKCLAAAAAAAALVAVGVPAFASGTTFDLVEGRWCQRRTTYRVRMITLLQPYVYILTVFSFNDHTHTGAKSAGVLALCKWGFSTVTYKLHSNTLKLKS